MFTIFSFVYNYLYLFKRSFILITKSIKIRFVTKITTKLEKKFLFSFLGFGCKKIVCKMKRRENFHSM